MKRLANLVIALGLLCAAGNRHTVAGEHPAWKTNLRDLGFSMMEPIMYDEALTQIACGSPDEIVVVDSPPLITGMTFTVKAFALDAHSGQVVREREWPQPWVPPVPNLSATASGKYLTDTGDGPRAFSLGLKDILEPPPCSGVASVDGRYFLLHVSHIQGYKGHAQRLMCDVDSCQPTGAEFGNPNVESIAGGRIATVGYKDGQAHVRVEGKDGSFNPYVGCSDARPRFVSDSLLAVFACGKIQVVDLSGGVLFSAPRLTRGRPLAAAARDGSRFATLELFYGWGDSPKLHHERVRVFDIAEKKEIFSVDIHEWHSDFGHSGMALAPDGSGLAVNSVGVVQYFRLPPKHTS
jgi:hypothetical protein